MSNNFFNYFSSKPSHITQNAYLPYYELIDKNGNLVGCIAGTHHQMVPGVRFEPSPRMEKCWGQATQLLTESSKKEEMEILRSKLKLSEEDLEKVYQTRKEKEEKKHNSIDSEWKRRAKIKNIPVKGLESAKEGLLACQLTKIENAITAQDGQEKACQIWTHYFVNEQKGKQEEFFHHCFMRSDTEALVSTQTGTRIVTKEDLLENFFGRNEKMASRISHEIQRKERPFIAIGLGHCLGEKGVPEILKAKYGLIVKEVTSESPTKIHIPVDKIRFANF